jgi:hypothetical protein
MSHSLILVEIWINESYMQKWISELIYLSINIISCVPLERQWALQVRQNFLLAMATAAAALQPDR